MRCANKRRQARGRVLPLLFCCEDILTPFVYFSPLTQSLVAAATECNRKARYSSARFAAFKRRLSYRIWKRLSDDIERSERARRVAAISTNVLRRVLFKSC